MSYFSPSATASFISQSNISHSLPQTPLHAPLPRPHNHANGPNPPPLPPHMAPMRLLMPTVRVPCVPQTPSPIQPSIQAPRSPRVRPTTNKLVRGRSASINEPLPTLATLAPSPGDLGMEWIGTACRFEIVQEQFQIEGYQMYAVEKWIVERTRPVTVLAVYTGDPSHKITVTALSPLSTLSRPEALEEWNSALHHLRREGARPKETPDGTLHTTSLALFRSDLNIVLIPKGDFLAVKSRLYANIGLLRMGCSGRSAVGLGDVSETTKDRFLSMYHIPDTSSVHTRSVGKSKSKSKSHSHSNSLTVTLSPTKSLSIERSAAPTDLASVATALAKSRAKDRTLFNATVLELVKLIQAALAVSGMMPMPTPGGVEMDGLLCDVTVEGIKKWVSEVGEGCVGVEPMERVADPVIVSALLSLVLATRNRLAAIGYSQVVPKDPFIHPQTFCSVLTIYSQSAASGPHGPSNHSPFHTPHMPFHAPFSNTAQSQSTQNLLASPAGGMVYLTTHTVTSIANAFASKSRTSDARKMHRVLFNKLDDIATDLRGGEVGQGGGSFSDDDDGGRGAKRSIVGMGRKSNSGHEKDSAGGQILSGIGSLASGLGLSGGVSGGAASVLEPTSNLRSFANIIAAGEKGRDREWEKDVGENAERGTAASLKGLWSGHVEVVLRMREQEREKHAPISATPKKSEPEREKGSLYSDGDTDGGKTTEDENDVFGGNGGKPWSGRMQKKIDIWAKINRAKKASIDLSNTHGGGLAAPPMSNESSTSAQPQHGAAVTSPTLGALSSRDFEDEDLLSSGQVSPISDAPHFMLSGPNSVIDLSHKPSQDTDSGRHASVIGSISDYERRLSAFNKKRPWPAAKGGQSRMSSWSDPISARYALDEDTELDMGGSSRSRSRSGSRSRPERFSFGGNEEVMLPSVAEDDEFRKRLARRRVRRRHSFHDLRSFQDLRVLLPERMKIDVGLCGQLLAMQRREDHLENVLACLNIITSSLASTNASLHDDYHSHEQVIAELARRSQVISQIEAERIKTEGSTQERNTLLYESEQFHVQELWHMASPPRQKVLDLRDKVFGTGGRRLPNGVRGAHGRFNRLQWTLDGRERLVDVLGRTESEVEEEEGLEAMGIAEHVDEEEEDVVENPRIKPMWLLRFFTSWGTRWSSPSTAANDEKHSKPPLVNEDPTAATLPEDQEHILDKAVT